jgi:uncharacterized protein YgbK (DUF1537 family)
MFLGVIADDFTGATDIAGFLVNNGLPTVQLNGSADVELPREVEAVVVSLKSRSCPAEEAVRLSLGALEYLRSIGCSHFFFKYCSTFDSTAKGNIGPVTDALMKALGTDMTVICPALPVNGRTVYQGYLFIGNVLLNESGMRNHPLNPMLDASLLRLMDAQSAGRSGNVPEQVIAQGAGAVRSTLEDLRRQGISYAVLDTLADADLDVLAESLADMPLVTGGSGLGGAIARRYARMRGGGSCATDLGLPASGGKTSLLSGSCSEMTNRQVAAYAAKAYVHKADITRCMDDAEGYAQEIFGVAAAHAGDALPPLISATVPPAELKTIQAQWGVAQSSRCVERFFARLAVLLRGAGYDHFIIAGGETSSVVSQALMVKGFYIGPQIAPGVPWVRTLDRSLSLALKSGNFGDEAFFAKALSFIPAGERS